MLVEEGYLGLSMDRIAEAIEYSKGIVYQHFAGKEEIVGALALETTEMRADMFGRAAAFNGRPRERLTAIGVADELFVECFPDHFRTEQIVEVDSINDKISKDMRQMLDQVRHSKLDVLLGIVRDAVTVGDLVRPKDAHEAQVLYGVWSMATGHHSQNSCARVLSQFAHMDLNVAHWNNYQMFLDGYGWKPLVSEWDYLSTVKRIKKEVFGDEVADGRGPEGTRVAQWRESCRPRDRCCWWQRRRMARTAAS